MAEGLHVEASAVARRCSLKSPDYGQLTSLDWVVLDFTDGVRSFGDMKSLIPVSESDLATAYIHLRLMGFLTWQAQEKQPDPSSGTGSVVSSVLSGAFQPALGGRQALDGASRFSQTSSGVFGSSLGRKPVSLMPTMDGYSDEVCRQYLPEHMFADFRRFVPTLVDEKLDIPVEVQVFAEFIYENLSSMSPYDLLGLSEDQCDRNRIRQAYQLRTKQFHPDRYFRKNIGPFAPRIAAISKAVSSAYTGLQSR